MTQVLAHNIKKIHMYRERVFYTLAASLVVLFCMYGYFVQQAIVNVVEREQVSKSIKTMSSDVIALEAQYFSMKNSIDLESAYEQGFSRPQVTTFISRKPLGAASRFGNEL